MRFYLEKLSGWVNPPDAFVALYSKEENSFWLERSTNQEEAVSIMGSAGSVLRLGDEALQVASDHLKRINEAIEKSSVDASFGFRPGLVGYIGYEYSSGARENQGIHPKAQFLIVERAMVFDHTNRQMYFVGVFESELDFREWLKAALLRLALIGGERAAFMQRTKPPKIINTKVRHDGESYIELIRRAKEFIARGDAYQLCLTNQIVIECEANPLRTFLTLQETNPAPYASYLRLGSLEIVSSSPEQFLKVTRDGQVSTKPIKGTRPRSEDPKTDLEIAESLRVNEKERAENLMIVDLMRNDLTRVCEPESVTVPSLFEVESYATVHQLVSKVVGKLRPGLNATSALAACFPGGSMTGAPKIRAMEILHDLEGGPRDIYSGVIGYLGFDGAGEFGMTIRTLVFEGGFASLGVGGGITIDSDPEAELSETMLKAKALISNLGGVNWKI